MIIGDLTCNYKSGLILIVMTLIHDILCLDIHEGIFRGGVFRFEHITSGVK
jgi:hypothetical protein